MCIDMYMAYEIAMDTLSSDSIRFNSLLIVKFNNARFLDCFHSVFTHRNESYAFKS